MQKNDLPIQIHPELSYLQPHMNAQFLKEVCLSDWSISKRFVSNTFAQITEVHICRQICNSRIFKRLVQFVLTEALKYHRLKYLTILIN
jgi:hypothetical protein